MPRYGDIRLSFHEAMRRNPKYGVTVSTSDFVAELAKRNWEMSHQSANEWIAQHVMTFRDVSPEEGHNNLWQRFYHYGEY
ncbi:DNA polymerase V [Pantoea ananatis]|nr:DNA polymerase V [Pantoea ananatis]